MARILNCVSNDQLQHFQNAVAEQQNSSIVIEDSDGESSRPGLQTETVASNVEYFEIVIQDDSANVGNEAASTSTNQLVGEAEAVDGGIDNDKAFGMLIAEELRKMTPQAQQNFKRNVTQLLYS